MSKDIERKLTAKFSPIVFDRDNHTCQICGATDYLEIHHIKPVHSGGKSTEENLITLCGYCHNYAPDDPKEFNIYKQNKDRYIASKINMEVNIKKFLNIKLQEYLRLGLISSEQLDNITITDDLLSNEGVINDELFDNTTIGKFMTNILASVRQMGGRQVSKRTKEVLADKKAQGIKLGKPFGSKNSKLDEHEKTILEMKQQKMGNTAIARYLTALGCPITTGALYSWFKNRKLLTSNSRGRRLNELIESMAK